MKRVSILVLLILMGQGISAQDKEKDEKKKFGIKFSGFVKNDFFYDSRQTVSAREGHFLLWPAPEKPDEAGNDINAKTNFNFLAIQSRLKAAITGPDAFGAKTSAVIEADFFAQLNANINLLRLRHAYLKLNWEHLELLAGQTWNPLFVTDCFPGTVSFNTGTPLQSFARNPQIRATYNISGFKIIAAALAQRDYATWGMGGASSRFLRNSAVPDMQLQLHYGSESSNSGLKYVFGAGIAFKTIVPRLESEMGPSNSIYKVNEKVQGLTAMGFAKITTKPVTIKFQARYGENITDLLAISGFAVKEVANTTTGELSYTPLTNMTFWGEIHSNGEKIQFGLFGGITNSLGTKEAMSDPANNVYGLGTNIKSLWRISPRVIFNAGKVRIALEMEYTQALYGDGFDIHYRPSSTTTASNFRGLLAVYYFF